MKIKGLTIINPKNWKETAYTGEFNETGMNTTIPKEILDKLKLKPGDGVMFKYKDNRISTTVGPNGRIGLTRQERKRLGLEK